MRFTLRSSLPMLKRPGVIESLTLPGLPSSLYIDVSFVTSHPIPDDKMGALTYLIFFIKTQLSQEPHYFRLLNDWFTFFNTPNPESLISKNGRIGAIFASIMSKSEQFQRFCELTRDPQLKQPANLREAIHVICHRTSPFHLRAERTQSAAILCAFLNQAVQPLTRALYAEPTVSSFGYDLPREFAFVQIQRENLEFITRNLLVFIEAVYEPGRPWEAYGRYFHKPSFPRQTSDGGRSFLFFTKQEHLNTFYIILKSNTDLCASEEEDILYARGSTKQNKLYNLLITLRYDPATQNLMIPPESPPTRIITLTEPVATFPQIPSFPGAPPVRMPSYRKEERLTQRTSQLRRTIQRSSDEFQTWDGILTFTGPDAPAVRRMLAYQIFAGYSLESEEVNTWSPTQKKYAIRSCLSDWKQIVCVRHILPSDIKFQNMCFQYSSAQPDVIALKFIDYISLDQTYSFLNNTTRRQPYVHPNPTINAYGRNGLAQFGSSKRHFNRREALNEGEFQLLIYHMFFEIIFLIFFIWNSDLFQENDRGFNYWLAYREAPFPTRLAAQTALNAGRPRPFTDTLLHYTYDQEFRTSTSTQEFRQIIQDMVRRFLTQLRHDLMTLPHVAHHRHAEIPLPDVPIPQVIQPIIDPNGLENDVLSEAWINSFANGIATICTTPSPFSQPPRVINLTMI